MGFYPEFYVVYVVLLLELGKLMSQEDHLLRQSVQDLGISLINNNLTSRYKDYFKNKTLTNNRPETDSPINCLHCRPVEFVLPFTFPMQRKAPSRKKYRAAMPVLPDYSIM